MKLVFSKNIILRMEFRACQRSDRAKNVSEKDIRMPGDWIEIQSMTKMPLHKEAQESSVAENTRLLPDIFFADQSNCIAQPIRIFMNGGQKVRQWSSEVVACW